MVLWVQVAPPPGGPRSVICNVFKMVILLCMSCIELYDHMNKVERLTCINNVDLCKFAE